MGQAGNEAENKLDTYGLSITDFLKMQTVVQEPRQIT